MIFILFLFFFLTIFFLLKDGDTALHLAAWKGFEQVVKSLVEHRSNGDLQNEVYIFFFLIFIFISFDFSHFFYLLLWFILDFYFMLIVNGCVIFILFLLFFKQLSFC